MKLIKYFSLAMLAISISMVSCSPEDGKDGINGIDGQNGTDGTNGVDGQSGENGTDGEDGANGVGFDELTKFGYITLKMEGTRADNVAFQDSTSFKFTPVAANFSNTNGVNSNLGDGTTTYEFYVQRFLSAPDNVYQESFMAFYLEITDPGQENESIGDFEYSISNYSVIGEDNKYFTIDHFFDLGNAAITEFEITDATYDTETNHLTFSYSWTVTEESNNTGHDLNISGTVDVTVLEVVELPEQQL